MKRHSLTTWLRASGFVMLGSDNDIHALESNLSSHARRILRRCGSWIRVESLLVCVSGGSLSSSPLSYKRTKNKPTPSR